ncbi:MAG TPA: type II secretion system protein [Candidatus Saccharimonadales bacterium]|nr:type II secretion system protein [Candidatus Saccharimonadales bacterium]
MNRQGGFTLLEVLVVVICMAILVSLVALYRTK